jgi:DNA-binding response OmpR family regulator
MQKSTVQRKALIRRHADTPIRRHADTPTRRYADTPTRRHADRPSRHANTPIRQHANTPTRQHADTPTRRHADTPTRRHADTPTRRHADTPIRQHADTPTRRHADTRRSLTKSFARDLFFETTRRVAPDSGKESKWKDALARLFGTRRKGTTDPSPPGQAEGELLFDPPAGSSSGDVLVCTPSTRLVVGWVKEVAQRGYRVTVLETLSPTIERIAIAPANAMLIDPGDELESAVQLVTLLRALQSWQSRFIGAIAHLPDQMRVIAKPLLEAGASRVFQPTSARTAQILIGLKIAFSPGRFGKVLVSSTKPVMPSPAAVATLPTILILESDASVANILKEMLEDHGFKIELALDADTALRMLDHIEPRAFLLDALVSELGGMEVLKEIRGREKFRQTPIVVSTSGLGFATERQLREAGATRVFDKPETGSQKILEIFEELLRPVEKPEIGSSVPADPQRSVAAGPTGSQSTAQPAAVSAGDQVFFAEIQESFLQEAPARVRELRESLDALNQDPSVENFASFDRKLHAVAGNAGLAGLARVGSLASAAAALIEDLQSKAEPLSNSVRKTLDQAVELIGELFGQADEFMPAKVAVMAVDDEEVSRRVLTHALQKVDLRPSVFGNPEESLKVAEESRFELIFLDVDMPEMDGFELCKRIRALPQYSETPVVFITSRDSLDAHAESARSGGSDFITKPFGIRELAVKALIYLLQKHGESAAL